MVPAGKYQVDKKWEFRSTFGGPGNPDTPYDAVATVVALEDVIVPAGTFKAYRVKVISRTRWVSRKVTYWMEPGWGFPIKVDFKLLMSCSGCPAPWGDSLVMASRQRGPG